jgi:hypothetical protein
MKYLRVLKLTTGEEILAELVPSNVDGHLGIKNALQLVLNPTERGFATIPVQWGNHTDETIVISAAHVIYNVSPRQELLDVHDKLFSKIVKPPQGLILG